jgi:chondroitin AC lyase
MIKTEGNEVKEISVSDPSRKSGKIHFSVNRKLNVSEEGANAFWKEATGTSDVSVDLPQSYYAGKSVTIHF